MRQSDSKPSVTQSVVAGVTSRILIVAFTAIYDACVGYPRAPIRDVLWFGMTNLYRARWTNQIHEKWIRSLLTNRADLTRAQLEFTRELMNAHAGDALIENFEDLIPSLSLPDPNDRHVLAAAIRGRADVIVTYNLKDFPDGAVTPYGIEGGIRKKPHPRVGLAPGIVLAALQRLRQSLRNPALDIDTYLARLEQHELPSFVAQLRQLALSSSCLKCDTTTFGTLQIDIRRDGPDES